MKTAVAYVTDTLLCPAHGVIGKDEQKANISKYAEENGIEITAWYEDEMCTDDVFARPGVLDFLNPRHGCGLVLVERVWSLSRNWAVLSPLFKEMDRRGLKLEAATTMHDAASQMTRRHFHPEMSISPVVARMRAKTAQAVKETVKSAEVATAAFEMA